MIPYEQAFGSGGKEKLLFNRKTYLGEPGSKDVAIWQLVGQMAAPKVEQISLTTQLH